MPFIDPKASAPITSVKSLLIGDSTTGKTGSLASLAAAGYKLRIFNFDNGLDALLSYVTNADSPYVKQNPECYKNVYYKNFHNPRKAMPDGRLIPTGAKAWKNAIQFIQDGKAPEDNVDFGNINTWGPDVVVVFDSLTMMAGAAHTFHLSMNAALGALRTQNEARRDIGATQQLIRDFLDLIFDPQLKCHILVISHITIVSETGVGITPDNKNDGAAGYPSAIGRALSPHIPRWFNSMLVYKQFGSGTAVRRKICTTPQMIAGQVVGAKSSAPLAVKSEYDIEQGLAEYFKAVLGKHPV